MASSNPVTIKKKTIGQFIMRNAADRLEISRILTGQDEGDASFAMVEVFPGGIPTVPSISPQGRRKRSEQGKYGRGNV